MEVADFSGMMVLIYQISWCHTWGVSHELLPLCQKTGWPLASFLSTTVCVPTTLSTLAVGFTHTSMHWAHRSHSMDLKQWHTNLAHGQWSLPPGMEQLEHEPHHSTQSDYEWNDLYLNLPHSPSFLEWCLCHWIPLYFNLLYLLKMFLFIHYRHMGGRWYSSTYSEPWHYVGLSCELHVLAAWGNIYMNVNWWCLKMQIGIAWAVSLT